MTVRLILDTDLAMGAGSDIDDGFALALAHADPEINLEMVTTVNGNTDVELATVLTRELMGRLGITGVPLHQGATAPLAEPHKRRRMPTELAAEFGHHRPDPGYAAAKIAELVMTNPGEITLCPIGPLTNIAAALNLEPDLASAVKEVVIMGGVFLGHTHSARMSGEFNVWCDPVAARAVLRSGMKQRWVGLDVTEQVRLTREHGHQLSASGSAFGQMAGAATAKWIDRLAALRPNDPRVQNSCAMHDPLAVLALTHPDLVTWADAHVDIVDDEGIARGAMVTDLLDNIDAPQPNCQIAVAVRDSEALDAFLGVVAVL